MQRRLPIGAVRPMHGAGSLAAVLTLMLGTATLDLPRALAQQAQDAGQAAAPQATRPSGKPAAKQAAHKIKSKAADAPKAADKPTMTREEATRLVEAGAAAQASGKSEDAARNYSQAIAGGALDPTQLARALHQRGAVYAAQGKSAAAISDLTQALYLPGMTAADRAAARQLRGATYQNAGMADLAEADFKAASTGDGGSVRATTTAQAPASTSAAATQSGLGGIFGGLFGGDGAQPPKAPQVATAPAPAPPTVSSPIKTASVASSVPGVAGKATVATAPAEATQLAARPAPSPPADSGGIGSLFDGLFGANSSAPSNAAASTPSAPKTTAVSASSPTFAAGAGPASPPASPKEKAAKAPAGKKTAGGNGIRVQVASVRSEEQARDVAAKVRTAGLDVGGREAHIEKAVLGNMGTFYHVQVGPFATEDDGQKACPALRAKGLDCLLVR